MIPVIIIRPGQGSIETAARARELGLEPLRHPLFELAPLEWAAPEPSLFDAVLITSVNAIRFGGNQLKQYMHLPCFAVGPVSAAAARAAGFRETSEGVGDGTAVVAMAIGHRNILHICGNEYRRLTHPDVTFTTLKVYSADPIPPTLKLLDCLRHPCVVLAHSPRAAERLADVVPDRSIVDLVAISPKAAAAAGEGWRSITSAVMPIDDAMLSHAIPLCLDAR